MKTKNLLTALALAGTLCISCSQDDSFSSTPSEKTENDLFKFNLLTGYSGAEGGGHTVSSLHAYAFSEGNYLKKFENIDVSANNFQLSLPADKQKTLYFLADHTALIVNGSTFSESILLTSVSSAAPTPPDVFLYAKASAGTTPTERADISLIRGVARIDINPGTDANMSIDSIQFAGGADRTYLFSGTPANIPADATGVVYKKKFAPPLAGGVGPTDNTEVFYVYENGAKEVNITIYGKYNGIDVEVTAKAPSMARNHIYTIKLQGVGQIIVGDIDIKPWEDGDDIIATPDI